MNRAEHIFYYPLFSFKRFPLFLKYSKNTVNLLYNKGLIRNKFITLLDMIWCNLYYGVMDSREYLLFDFYKKNHNARNTYFTKRMYFRLIKKFDKSTFFCLTEKENQYKSYAEFIKRAWILIDSRTTKEEISSFMNEVGSAILKPVSSDCGRGIKKINSTDDHLLDCVFQNRESVSYIAEEVLSNCIELKAINPTSLNTIRVTYVLRKDGSVNIFSVMLRTGAISDVVVDNWGAGGILLDVDLQTGIITKPGLDENHNEYTRHPLTNINFLGLKIPRYYEILEFSKAIALKNPKVIYGGLDIAITDNGLELIELNFPPANIEFQVFGKGALKEIQTIKFQ